MDTVDGVVHVMNDGQPPQWRLEHLLSLGSEGTLGEPRPDEFGLITSITIGPQNRLYVADSYYSEVRVFDLAGEFLFDFGREGGGPGEFLALYSLAWMGDTLLALDFGNGRIGELDASGRWLGQRRVPGRITGSPGQLRLYRVARDEVYAWSLEVVDGEIERVFNRHIPAGAEGQLAAVRLESGPPGAIRCDTPDGGFTVFDIPFTPRLIQRPARDQSLAVAWTEDYRIAFLRSESDTVRVVERAAEPVPVGEAEWEAGLEEYRAFRDEREGEACRPRSISKPERKPPIADFYLDWTGRLWVEAVTADGTVWELFDSDGRLIGRLPAVPRSERVAPYFGREHHAVVVRDSLDVQSVEVYRFGDPGE
ncbi:MAG: 6-bladed beta-propeller [Gemmatimonadetes bacterium]|nr:6-bladed beta-propeller [Gemmatimonadota bacterium]